MISLGFDNLSFSLNQLSLKHPTALRLTTNVLAFLFPGLKEQRVPRGIPRFKFITPSVPPFKRSRFPQSRAACLLLTAQKMIGPLPSGTFISGHIC